ncbi:LysE family translocator [Gloeocapsopsis crepidinum LEGE 06123]|uniref:LysE family translocator n=1 Tax=Gloeocapsopsis crepidinum LEGE 06123 TaxID=588587 RepID=A0ABR9UQI4_9CHRO|nr:LysE family translocator [Gloeocapsopsis crepidinum]MBE9190524.1 LysE family translocator [Gloeocapsopsis crepidinum LEGE 06123]
MLDSSFAIFIGTAIVLIVKPGSGMLYVTARTLRQGLVGAIFAIGLSVGILVHVLTAVAGLSALLMTSTVAYNIVKYAGAGYLIYLGIRTLLERDRKPTITIPQTTTTNAFSQGLLTNIFNPELALFFLSFLPQFVDPTQGNATLQTIALGILFVILSILWLTVVVLILSKTGTWLQTWFHNSSGIVKLQKWLTGSILIFIGFRLALSEQE